MPRYQLVIFDFDGTLADSAPWFLGELGDLAERHRFRKLGAAQIAHLRGRPSREIVKAFGVRWWRMPAIARDMRRRSAEAAHTIPLFAGVPDLLADLSAAGVTLAVVSSNGEATVRAVLGASAGLIDHYGCGVSLFGKARVLAALPRRLGLARNAVLCVGDEVRDVEAARKAGLAAGAVTWGYANEAALTAAGPAFVFPSLEALKTQIIP
ncbi:phosphoglycolate phosphatase [Caulobacter ginsengisoli]|uniref:Phosphoglycolate phosphatase n=1 Tax=Caulobacter ginsengisoli TaxID=400775 RepID=A0ABU0IVS7_9CAUL|nr:HAD hydrolase-like protein [Caulobacter ginsengisoli]MDQ0466121.1 phosphoglycolate phosphatase [Caulobacter ginsengisoli]